MLRNTEFLEQKLNNLCAQLKQASDESNKLTEASFRSFLNLNLEDDEDSESDLQNHIKKSVDLAVKIMNLLEEIEKTDQELKTVRSMFVCSLN